jgi:hypothetical protein
MSEHDATEEKKDKKNDIKIFIGGKEFDVETRHMNGMQIKTLGGIPTEYQLFLEQPGDDKPIADAISVELKDGMHFYGIPPATFGA